ncbi:MAG: nucleoside triphosphate pyrophosphohydrolase [Thermoanaerobacterales bacterium]|nr:nucleoside triphosphate pyrophosphohydrolase [Thermoanaerobacterales bacterium]
MKKIYNKLVRDRIPEIIECSGKKAAIRAAGEAEYKQLLRQKLLEEVNEYMENGSSEELADILEVITALAGTHSLSFADLVKMAEEKRKERGGFEERIVLISVEE